MAPGFRYPHGNSDLWLVLSCLMSLFSKFCSPFIDFVDWRVCGADARGFTGTQHSWWGKQKPLAGYFLLSVLGTVTTRLVYLACVFSFCRQSCQRSTAGQKRSWKSLFYQTPYLIIHSSETDTEMLALLKMPRKRRVNTSRVDHQKQQTSLDSQRLSELIDTLFPLWLASTVSLQKMIWEMN